MRLASLVFALLLVSPAALRAAEPLAVPLDKVVEALVADLGAEGYDTRERATEAVRRIGRPAIPALEKAAESDDPEIRIRARDVLADVRLGIGPDWPSDVVLLIRHYDRLGEGERQNALQRIGTSLGVKAADFLICRLAQDDENSGNNALNFLQRLNNDDVAAQLLRTIKEPKSDVQKRAVAWARARAGQPVDSIEISLKEPPKEAAGDQAADAAVEQIIQALKEKKCAEAAKAAEEAAQKTPTDPRFLYLQAEALIGLDKDKQALALRDKAAALNPDKEAPHYLAGTALAKLGRRRLAAAEFEKVLDAGAKNSFWDANACLRLSSLYSACGLFERSAQILEKALDRYSKLRDEGEDKLSVPPGAMEGLRGELNRLRRKAEAYPTSVDAPLEDDLGGFDLRITAEVVVKEGKAEDLQRALKSADVQLDATLPQAGLRIFDIPSAALRYDPAKKQIGLFLHDTSIGKPVPCEPKEKEAQIVVRTGDSIYLFKADAASGKVEKTARYDLDYRIALQPGSKLATFSDVDLKINGKPVKWEEALKGLTLDRLPEQFDIDIEGTSAAGKRSAARLAVKAAEVSIKDPQDKKP